MNYLYFKKLYDYSFLPRVCSDRSSVLYLYTSQTVVMYPQSHSLIPTGVAAEIPEGYHGKVTSLDRDPMYRNLDILPEIILPGEHNEIFVSAYNSSTVQLRPVAREVPIAQLIVIREEQFIPKFSSDFICGR